MKSIGKRAAAMTAAILSAVMLLTGCGNKEEPSEKGGTANSDKVQSILDNVKSGLDYKEMWKVLPKIDETPIENLVYEYNVEFGGMAVTGYKVQSPKVRIPDTIEGEPVIAVDLHDYTITEIIMPDTVKRAVLNKSCLEYANYPLSLQTYDELFGERSGFMSYSAPGSADEAFKGSSVKAVYIPDGIKYIPSKAFEKCKSLETVNIPITVTSIEDFAFDGCDSLKSITLPDYLNYLGSYWISYDNTVITYKGKKYTSDNYNDLFVLVCYRDGLFIRDGVLLDSVEDITKVVIPDSVTEIGSGAFSNRKNLRSVTIPDSVTKISSSAFDGSENVVVTYKGKTYSYEHLSDWLVDAVEVGEGGMQIENGVLKSVSRELTSVVIPDGVTRIGENAFNGCTSLTSVTIPGSVTAIGGGAFSGCASLTSMTIPGSVTKIGDSAFYSCTSLTSVTIPGSVTEIGKNAFKGCVTLTSVTIPDGVTEIGSETFFGNTSLTSVTIGSGVTEIGNDAFNGCASLTSVTIPGSVTEIGRGAFNDCRSLTSVIIPDRVTWIGDRAFSGCTNLTNVTVFGNVTEIGAELFSGCTSLTSMTISGSVTEFDVGDLCRYCANLTSITVDKSNPNYSDFDGILCVKTDGEIRVLMCPLGKSGKVNIPNGVTKIIGSAFYECASLTSVTISNGVTEIGGTAFGYCTSLTSVIIPDSVTKIDGSAFNGCKSLTVTYKGKTYDYEHRGDLYKAINSN